MKSGGKAESAKDENLELRDEIIRHARELFIARGFSSVTMDEICAGLRISKKTLYAIFPSKEDLFEFGFAQTIADIEAEESSIFRNRRLGLLERLSSVMELQNRSYSFLSRPLLEDIRRFAPSAWRKIDESHVRTRKWMGELVTEGIKAGLFRPEMNLELGLVLYTELVRSVLSPEFLIKSSYGAAEVNATILQIFLHSMLSEKGRVLAKEEGLI